MDKNVTMYIIGIVLLFYSTNAYGIECLHCTNVVLNKSSIPEKVQLLLSKFEATFMTPECPRAHSGTSTSNVALKNCTDATHVGKINRCGRLVGNLRMSSDTQLTGRFDVLIYIFIRGCFFVDQTTKGGCYTDNNILDDQRVVISETFESFTFLKIGEFSGDLCVSGTDSLSNRSSRTTYHWWTFIVFYATMAT